DIIVQEARRLAHLVENVLQYSRAERRVLRVRPEPHRLAPLVREIVERFAPLAGSAALRIRTELDEALVARVHPESLHQVLVNLLDNAVKHGGPGGTIALRTKARDGWARIEVEDQGPGIPSEERERVFQPFVRLPRPGPAGSGIGLAVVRELVQAQEGRCLVEDGAGGGARFVVELPGAARGESAGRTAQPTTAGAR
ncbi:MAG: sensor histidine kinase, partial [Gemmatimonadales bacterium]